MRSDLVVRAQSGDREAFDALAAGLYDRLYSISRRILRDGHGAEDAVQEALIRGWRDLRSLRDPNRFEAWMHRLLVRACHDQARRGASRFEITMATVDFGRSDPVDEYAAVAHRDELERAFLELPIDQRAVIVLTHYVGMPAPQVAEVLGVPAGTVYSRLHYGLRHMRAGLLRSAALSDAVAEHGR